jgi:hypothetical protein
MPYIPRTQTITRRTIKRVESQLKGLGQFDISGAYGSFKAILDWISGRSGELKVTATEFAEGMVKLMYGVGDSCGMPPAGLPIIANNPSPTFCAGSVAGMIERCRISDAQFTLDSIKSQFAEKTRKSGTSWIYEEGPYVKAWQDQYGNNDFSNLATKITAARATCGIGGGGPVITPVPVDGRCPPNFRFNPATERCDYVLPGVQTGLSSTTMMMILGAAALFIFAMKR